MIIIWYVALFALLFFGAHFCEKGTWNTENMSFVQTKNFLGFCAVIIVFHHISQDTCASWLNPRYIRHGLDIFVTAGYPMVAMFLFCSGFGLYKSAKSKPDFFKRFLPVRLIPILIPTLLTLAVYIGFRIWRGVPLDYDFPFAVNGHTTWHPYVWYVPCVIWMYILFFIGFGIFKKDKAGIAVVATGTVFYILFCIGFGYGTWWFNTAHMFLVGILTAKYEERILTKTKKHYVRRLVITLILFPVFWYLGNYAGAMYLWATHHSYNTHGYISELFCCIFQIIYTFVFVSMYYLLSLKIKLGNRALSFFGKFTLELYLVHGIFIHMFGFFMIREGIKPVHYIENVTLFTLVVFALAIPIAWALSLLDKKVGKMLRKKPEKKAEL